MKLTILDQSAIDHVASVSKHPHAAMIVKWLITGWDVVYEGKKDRLIHPCWSKDDEYELVEPKPPAKPAYRVYRYKPLNITCTIDRDINGEPKEELPPDSEWISEWIEYDQPKKWPTPLVERIAAIDLDAAQWIVDHWDDLLDEKYTYKGKYSRDSERLASMFDWEKTDFNFDWLNISDKLVE